MIPNLARNTDMAIAAEQLKAQYEEYIRAGFSREESLKIVCTILQSTIVAKIQTDYQSKLGGKLS